MKFILMDKVFSVLVIMFAVVCGTVACGYSFESSYFPRFLSAFILVMALVLGARLKFSQSNEENLQSDLKDQLIAGLSVLISIAVYCLSIQIVNFEISTILFISSFIFFLGYRNFIVMALVSVITTAVVYGIFFEFLAVSRPESIFFQ